MCVLALGLDSFSEGSIPWPPLADSRANLRHDRAAGYVAADASSSALGLRGGVPATAATVDTAAVVEATLPTIADQIRNPSSLLLPLAERPLLLRRSHLHLDKTYGSYMKEAVQCGLQRVVRRN